MIFAQNTMFGLTEADADRKPLVLGYSASMAVNRDISLEALERVNSSCLIDSFFNVYLLFITDRKIL